MKIVNHINTSELCERLGVTLNTIQRWRTSGVGPKFIVVGGRSILYPIDEVVSWESNQKRYSSIAEVHMSKRDPGVTQKKGLSPTKS